MSIFSYFRSHVFVVSVIGVFVIIVAVLVGRAASQKAPAANTSGIAHVTLVNAAPFRKGNINVSADGTVQSSSQADLRSQISAPITLVNVDIGSQVSSGQTILELSNADIRAQLAQAEASLVLAQGQYGSTRQGSIDKVKSAYLAADSAVHTQIDQLLLNNTQAQATLYSYVTDPTLGDKIRSERSDLTTKFIAWKPVVDALSASSTDSQIHDAITLSQTDMNAVSSLLDDVSSVLNDAANKALPSTLSSINALLTIVTAARNSVTGANSNLTSAATTIATNAGTNAAQAQVQVAEAGVQNLQAQLAKTIVTSPISGTISTLPLRVGELASPGALLATVVGNTSALEVKSYVSADDLSQVKVGQAATIGGTVKGTVSNVAPSVDATTRKAEVDIDILNSSHSDLVVGQNVSVSIATLNQNQISIIPGQNPTYILPIQDVKIIPGAAYVFTVDENSKIKRNDVTLGQIQGDFIEVTGGINDSMNIVTPVYELDEGEQVRTQ